MGGEPNALLAAATEEYGPDAPELDTVRILVRYSEIYGFPTPARQQPSRHANNQQGVST
ncbi:hypothetical protein [Streptomyces sp. NPDC002785]|uniref:hypothetical protein n=1 Tax=Streptomyces sp. NPDC002785 TaxID=3154543 RepID=UPI0033254704